MNDKIFFIRSDGSSSKKIVFLMYVRRQHRHMYMVRVTFVVPLSLDPVIDIVSLECPFDITFTANCLVFPFAATKNKIQIAF